MAKPKKEEAEVPEAEAEASKAKRSRFADLYPEDATIKVNAETNPKKEGSAAKERFEHYYKSGTVGDYLAAGGTYQDIAYDVGRNFVSVGV